MIWGGDSCGGLLRSYLLAAYWIHPLSGYQYTMADGALPKHMKEGRKGRRLSLNIPAPLEGLDVEVAPDSPLPKELPPSDPSLIPDGEEPGAIALPDLNMELPEPPPEGGSVEGLPLPTALPPPPS